MVNDDFSFWLGQTVQLSVLAQETIEPKLGPKPP